MCCHHSHHLTKVVKEHREREAKMMQDLNQRLATHIEKVGSKRQSLGTMVAVVLLLLSLSSGMRLTMVTVFCSSFLSSLNSSHTAFSTKSLYLLLYFAVVLHSPSLSRSPLTQSSHRIIGLPRILIPSTFWASALFPNFSSPVVSICPAISVNSSPVSS